MSKDFFSGVGCIAIFRFLKVPVNIKTLKIWDGLHTLSKRSMDIISCQKPQASDKGFVIAY